MVKKGKHAIAICMVIMFILTITTSGVCADTITDIGLEAFFDETMKSKMEKYCIPNATVSVVRDGQIVYKEGFGFADIEKKIPVDPDTTLFRIGSTSKLITWTAVMRLVEDGKLDLNADVNTYLDFVIPSQLVGALKQTAVEPITLTHLMTHTAGFEDYPDMLFRLCADECLALSEYVKDNLPARIFPPGKVAAYSNYGTALAGYIVAKVSGVPFSQYVEENILQPLQMKNSTFRQPPALNASHMAKPYRYVNGSYMPGSFEYILPEPAGSMSSTASDMANFMIAHLNSGGELLKDGTLKKMHTRHFTHNPALGGMTLGFMEGVFNDKKVLFHGGGTMLYSTGLYLLPEERIGIFISYSGGSHIPHSEVFQEFMDNYYPCTDRVKEVAAAGSQERNNQFKGEYQMNRRSVTTDEKINSILGGGIITVNADKEGYLLVTHLGETNRFIEIDPGVYQNLREGRTQDYFGPFHKIVFQKDPYGRIMLTTDGPMTYSKAPFYATLNFTAAAFAIIFLIIFGSLFIWAARGIVRLFKRSQNPYSRSEATALWIAAALGVLVISLIAGILSAGGIDPVYQLPKEAYMPVPICTVQKLLPVAMSILTLALIPFTGLAWRQGLWTVIGRIHYTLYSLAALGLLLIMHYWNLF